MTTYWKTHPIFKNPDGSFNISHPSGMGEHPYNVCHKELDPANAYDLDEVSAFWESLPSGSPLKQVTPEPEPIPDPIDTRTPEERREAAYVAEADIYRDKAISYEVEAEACRLDGDLAAALAAEEKMNAALRLYRAKKEEIRARYPDPGYILATSGVYHVETCAYVPAGGTPLPLAAIRASNPNARPCGRCNPPALEG